MEEEGVSLPSSGVLTLLGSCRVYILLFSSTPVLTAVAPSHGQHPHPKQFQSRRSPARHPPSPQAPPCGRPLPAVQRVDFQPSYWGGTSVTTVSFSNKVRISGLRGNGLFLGCSSSVIGVLAAVCIFEFCILHRILFALFIPPIIRLQFLWWNYCVFLFLIGLLTDITRFSQKKNQPQIVNKYIAWNILRFISKQRKMESETVPFLGIYSSEILAHLHRRCI